MLDMARIPLPKIGSFTTHDSGGMSLDNRPLTMQRPLLESRGIPVSIPRGRTYITTDSYICDLLDCHDMKLRQQPNSVRDDYGAEGQTLTLLWIVFDMDLSVMCGRIVMQATYFSIEFTTSVAFLTLSRYPFYPLRHSLRHFG